MNRYTDKLFKFILLIPVLGLTACLGTLPLDYQESREIKSADIEKIDQGYGVVSVGVNWGRRWACADYENAQIYTLMFNKLPVANVQKNTAPDFVLQTPALLRVNPVFLFYEYALPEGEYALSGWTLKAAKTSQDIQRLGLYPHELLLDGKPKGGTFRVTAGEVNFIGMFGIDCADAAPIPWRYYIEGKQDFERYIQERKKLKPYLQDLPFNYELFGGAYGLDYSLDDD